MSDAIDAEAEKVGLDAWRLAIRHRDKSLDTVDQCSRAAASAVMAAIATACTLTAEASAEEIAGLRRRLSRSDARADRLDSIAAGRGVRARAAEAERDALLSMLGRIAAIDGVEFDPRSEECIADGVDALADRVAELESEAAGVASAERERIVASFIAEADRAKLGQRFNGGGLDGASIYNVYMHGAAHVMDSPAPTSDAATLAEDEREVPA